MRKFPILHEINNRSFLMTLPWPSSLTVCLWRRHTEAATGSILLKKDVLKNFAKFIRKHLWQNLLLIKITASSLLKRDSSANVFPRVLQNVLEHCFHTSEQPLLDIASYLSEVPVGRCPKRIKLLWKFLNILN